MARFKGQELGLWLTDEEPTDPESTDGYDFVGLATSHTFEVSVDDIDGATKDDGAWNDVYSGRKGYSLGVEGMADRSGQEGQDVIEQALLDDTQELFWLLTTGVAGDVQRWGRAAPGAFSLTAGDQEMATFSATLSGKGKFERGVVS